ncbi:MAG TPA: VanZ family protein [Candidatus Mediterraneibacter intestinigallinarum]|nr:VanZ family protein [Candidatus Mediterraneibacter intestinigallinarum]
MRLYIIQYKYLLLFIAVFVLLYIFFMHWLNVRFLNKLRQPAALISLAVELAAIASFTLLFREAGAYHTYELELFWSYRLWIFGKNIALGMEILNNMLLFFPLGFVLTDALKKCPFWAVLLVSGTISCAIEFSQFYFKIGLFEFDDIFNNVLGALMGWCVFHILRSLRRRKRKK